MSLFQIELYSYRLKKAYTPLCHGNIRCTQSRQRASEYTPSSEVASQAMVRILMPDAVGWLLTFSSLTDQRCLATKTYCNTSRGTTLKPALPCSDTVG